MIVANLAFLLDRLAADTPLNQQIRELSKNGLEAIHRRQKAGNGEEGLLKWDVDWYHLKRTGHYKLCVVDNGDGMTPTQMREYLNSLAVQGANNTQSISENFGVGAKITALYRNRHGLVYQSWKRSSGAMVKLHRDDKLGEYGLASFDLPDGPDWAPRLKSEIRPRGIESSGTKVTLLGDSEESNTCLPPENSGGMNWLVRYLTNRFFRLPKNVKVQVRVLTQDTDRWPAEEPAPSEKTFNLQTIHGMQVLLNDYSSQKGTVRLGNADAHWWLFKDPAKASKDMSTRGARTCQVGLVFQDEVYIQRLPPVARRILAAFGVIFGAEHVVLFIEPRVSAGLDIRADTARSRVIINGTDVEDANWWEQWGQEFKEQMPPEIKATIDEIMARSNDDPDGKLRERIQERLKRIRELLHPSRYRRSSIGALLAEGTVSGGAAGERGGGGRGGGHSSGGRGRRATDDYLADLVQEGGEPAIEVKPVPREPQIKWVSRAKGDREEGEMEDVAAQIYPSPATGDLIKVNADFRGYADLIDYFGKQFNQGGDSAIQQKIVECVQEWMELQLIESVVSTRNLANGRTWTDQELERALSSEALTTLLMSRFHIFERVKRHLSTELSRVVSNAA
jgi:hypothetical protein